MLLPRLKALQRLTIRSMQNLNTRTAHLVFRGQLLIAIDGMHHLEHIELGYYGGFRATHKNVFGRLDYDRRPFQPALLRHLELAHCYLWDRFSATLHLPALIRLALTELSDKSSGLGTLGAALACMSDLEELVLTGRGKNSRWLNSATGELVREHRVQFGNEAFAVASALSRMPRLRMVKFSGTDLFESAVMVFTMSMMSGSGLQYLKIDIGNATETRRSCLGSGTIEKIHLPSSNAAALSAATPTIDDTYNSAKDYHGSCNGTGVALAGLVIEAHGRRLTPVATSYDATRSNATRKRDASADGTGEALDSMQLPPTMIFPFT